MNILKLTDGVPAKYSEGSLKRDNPQVSFPNPLNERVLADFDCYIYTIDPTPEYNSTLQHVTSFFQQREELWYQAWNVVDFEEDAAKDRLKEQVTSDRWNMEQSGVEWLDSNFDLLLIATEENSQVKMTSVLSVLNSNPSFTGYSNWKAKKKVGENWEAQFRQTTLEEYNEIITLVK